MMDHEHIRQLLPAYVDQELGIIDALAVERHLETCLACRREIEEQRSVSMRTRAGAAYFEAPAALRARIGASLPARESTRTSAPWWQACRLEAAAALMASLALTLALGWGIGEYRAQHGALSSMQHRQTEELVASHVRSLQVDHLADVTSSDQHTVKPWFIGKLDFAPPVVDLGPQGFPLIGGRLDYLGGRAVAVLVYRRNRHPINLYIWPGADMSATPHATQSQGYHLVRWSDGGMNFSAVSDVADSDLAQFAQAVRARTTGRQ
jgi:anti-sigma factor RsiW